MNDGNGKRLMGMFNFSGNFEVQKQGPLDTRMVVTSITELLATQQSDGSPTFQYWGMLVVVSNLIGAALQDPDVIESRFVSLSIGGVLFVLSYILGFIKLSLFLNFIGFNILYWNVSTYGVAFSLLGIIALIINLSYAVSVLYIVVVNSLDEK